MQARRQAAQKDGEQAGPAPVTPAAAELPYAGNADGAGRLFRLAAIAEELGSGWVADQARELAARLSEGRFYVACVGQFKRGKSTLINALIGEPLLPVGFVPVTAVPTVVRFGEQPRARLTRLEDEIGGIQPRTGKSSP